MKFRIVSRAGWLPALGIAVAGVSACSDGDPATTTPPDQTATAGDAEVTGLRAAAAGVTTPFDATPDPKGERIIFTTLGAEKGAVMIVPKAGGSPTMLADDFVAPVQVVTSIDGTKAYVADLAADSRGETESAEGRQGVIYSVALPGGGSKTALEGTRGYRPRGLEVAKVDGTEWIYFVGIDPADGVQGVFRTTDGASIEAVKKGAPFASPSCVAIAKNGDLYVTDIGSRVRQGSVIKVSGGNASILVDNIHLGTPAGIALSESEKFLLVSALRSPSEGGTAVVHRVDLGTNAVAAFDQGINTRYDSGGIHRAHESDTFAWADSAGTVFLVGTKKNPLP